MKSGRRWRMAPLVADLEGKVWWQWAAWRLFERVEGMAPSEANAERAIEHFLDADFTYSL